MATVIGAGWAGGKARPSQQVFARRRFTVAGALAATVVGCVAMAGGFGTASPSHGVSTTTASAAVLGMAPAGAKVYIVQPGDTLWGIASGLVGDGDPRPLMQALETQLHGGILQVGERLVLPSGL